jgi:hypothetical protein
MSDPVAPAAEGTLEVRPREPGRAPLPVAALCGWVSLLVPLVVATNAIGGWPDWQTDLAVVRNLGLTPIGWEGGLSTLLSQLSTLLPLGGRLLRAEWVSALALALGTRLLYSLIRRALERMGSFAPNPLIALSASLLFALAPAARLEAGRIGGQSLALALILLGVHGLWHPSARRDARLWVLVAGLSGLSFAQDQAAGLALGLLIVARAVLEPGTPAPRVAPALVGAALAGFALCSLLHGVRRLGLELWAAPLVAEPGAELVAGPWLASAWASLSELGPLVVGPAAVGALLALASRSARAAFLPFLSLVGIELALRVLWSLAAAPPPASAELAACAGASALFALSVQALGRWAWRVELPFAKPACALLLAYCATLVVERLDALAAHEEQAPIGAEVWTEQALARLPAQSLVLVRSDALMLRLWAARVLHDERPDVVLMPAALFARGALGRAELPRTPVLAPLVRQLAVSGFADEYTLRQLADVGPLFAELDPHWDTRSLEHVASGDLWLSIAAHARAPSDRARAALASLPSFRAVVRTAEAEGRPADRALRRVLAELASQQALSLAALGDRAGARVLLRSQRALDRNDPLALALRQRLADDPAGKLALHELID